MKIAGLILIASLGIVSCCIPCKRSNRDSPSTQANGLNTYNYVPDKNKFLLLDGTWLTTDTANAAIGFVINNGKRIVDSSYGFIFSIPFHKVAQSDFTFTFNLLDPANSMYPNGIGETLCQLYPKQLKNEIQVVLKQKNIDSAKGWTFPVVTDTINYIRLSK